eukprot:TRINITY_DN4644_c0_g1_i1.p1 TRINITY_DN4644_c0_g1~~TRINITY_DN4644_c0_g1_i1.p1  ORF type:complete len:215 (-),score=60.35 TRINITY_DN4644_c0_g1_i1:40-651(-)
MSTNERNFKHGCIFCGASVGNDPKFLETARELGKEFALQGIELVYGGGRWGLMGEIASAVLQNGGQVVGYLPRSLKGFEASEELAGFGTTIEVETMHERKMLMSERAEFFVAMPGGFGTLDELFEIITWLQLGIHSKPIGLLNISGYFEDLLHMISHSVQSGFIDEKYYQMLVVDDNPKELISKLRTCSLPEPKVKWLTREQI